MAAVISPRRSQHHYRSPRRRCAARLHPAGTRSARQCRACRGVGCRTGRRDRRVCRRDLHGADGSAGRPGRAARGAPLRRRHRPARRRRSRDRERRRPLQTREGWKGSVIRGKRQLALTVVASVLAGCTGTHGQFRATKLTTSVPRPPASSPSCAEHVAFRHPGQPFRRRGPTGYDCRGDPDITGCRTLIPSARASVVPRGATSTPRACSARRNRQRGPR